jgi:Family of unknown function (DUF6519)
MYGDFSRLTFDSAKHYSAVLIQQGRVLLDSDYNEQAAILLHQLRTTAADLIGPHGGPAGDGFKITPTADASGKVTDLGVGPGHYYVDGILCENEVDDVTYLEQPGSSDHPLPSTLPFLAYLRVFERPVTAVEDPSIREVALGDNGPDTAVRAQVAWQILASTTIPGTETAVDGSTDQAAVQAVWQTHAPKTDRLKARGRQPTTLDQDPCIIPPEARYRGAENQLYRVEIHTGGDADQATFMYSRDNGSMVFAISKMAGAQITVTTLGRDDQLGLAVGDWVEIVDDRYTHRGQPEPLQRVKRIDPIDLVVELENEPPTTTGQNPDLHPFLRRWDQREPLPEAGGPALAADNALQVVESDTGWIDLEDGVQIQFQPRGTYTRGDFWLIPARTATGDVVWPKVGTKPAAREPHGVLDHIAPLAVVIGADSIVDLRCLFTRLACPPAV